MAKATKKSTVVAEAPIGARYAELKRMLEERRREIMSEVQGKIRDVRAEGSEKPHEVLDQGETSEVDIQEDIEFALIQMKAETLNKINEALCAARGRQLRPVFRVRRGDCRSAASRAAVRGPLQGLRGGSRERPAARAGAGPSGQQLDASLRHAGITPGVLELQAPPEAGPVGSPSGEVSNIN